MSISLEAGGEGSQKRFLSPVSPGDPLRSKCGLKPGSFQIIVSELSCLNTAFLIPVTKFLTAIECDKEVLTNKAGSLQHVTLYIAE